MQRCRSWQPRLQQDGLCAIQEMQEMLAPLVEQRRAQPREDMISAMLVLASDGELQEHRDFIEQHNLSGDIYVSSEILGKQYAVSKLPYAVLIDDKGLIASLGLVNSREHFESLFESMERGIPSLQAYMAANSTPITYDQQQA
jgi:methylamine dehydrogenase accessory protein MauD